MYTCTIHIRSCIHIHMYTLFHTSIRFTNFTWTLQHAHQLQSLLCMLLNSRVASPQVETNFYQAAGINEYLQMITPFQGKD